MSRPMVNEDHGLSPFGPYFKELEEITFTPDKELGSLSSGNITEDEKEEETLNQQNASTSFSRSFDGADEIAWLDEAGLSNLASPFREGQELDSTMLEGVMATLTKSQAATVKKRVDKLNRTLRMKRETDETDSDKKRDVREIFPQPPPPKEQQQQQQQHVGLRSTDGTASGRKTPRKVRRVRTAPEHNVIQRALVKNYKETTTGIAAVDQGVKILSFTHTEPVEVPRKQPVGFEHRDDPATPDSTLDLSGIGNTAFISLRQEDLFKSMSISLPNITIEKDLLGTTPVDYLSAKDIEKVRQISLIELTAMFDRVGICPRPIRKSSRKKVKETGVFRVPLSILVERDKDVKPDIEVPIFLQKLVSYIEEKGLKEEGVLRVPGSISKIKELQEEVEKLFYNGDFRFKGIKVNDAVGLLKLFLRELPSPPLTLEYVNAFSSIDEIKDRKKQLQSLNLLILVLPDVYRATLKLLLSFLSKIVENESDNRMSLNNVAMIMAPNLFSVKSVTNKKVVDYSELLHAAGTSNITRMLVKYYNILWVVPFRMLEQVRKMVDNDIKKTRESKSSVMTIFNKKAKEKRKSMIEDVLEGIIRIQTPGDEEKVFTTVQLSEHTTADDIVARFTQDLQPISTPVRRSTTKSFKSKKNRTLDNYPAFGALGGVPLNKTLRFYLYEVGGNIGSRCLDPETNMLALVRINPAAQWVIRPRIV